MALPTKRFRQDENAVGEDPSEKNSDLLQQLLKADPKKLAMAGRNDGNILSELINFSDKLRASIESVKKARDEEEKAAQVARAKAIRAKIEEKKRRLIASNSCFECNKSVDILNPCAGFKLDEVHGDGVLVCEECEEKITKGTCPECNTFLCNDSSCCDDSYKCKECKEMLCLPCAEKDGYGGESCDCGDWYCSSCADNHIVEEKCCSCSKINTVCGNCDYNRLEKCDGDCNEPLCNNCVQTLACGNDARLCGNCEHDCEDCDYCAGYCGRSRWK